MEYIKAHMELIPATNAQGMIYCQIYSASLSASCQKKRISNLFSADAMNTIFIHQSSMNYKNIVSRSRTRNITQETKAIINNFIWKPSFHTQGMVEAMRHFHHFNLSN